ncbi:hypothetical protein, partial [Pseudomonas aeruginosa]
LGLEFGRVHLAFLCFTHLLSSFRGRQLKLPRSHCLKRWIHYTHLRVHPEAVQTRSQFILAMEHFMASDLPEAQKVVLVQRLTQAIFKRSAEQLADSTDLAGMVGHRVMARAAAGGRVTLAEFEQVARLENHRDQVAGTPLASQAPA